MWQRVQTLYLAIATVLVASLFWSDVARIDVPDGAPEYLAYTSRKIYLVWLILLTVIQVLALGGYKWRMKQLRVVIVAAVMCLGFQGWLVYDFIQLHDSMLFSWTALFPIVAAVLDALAAKNILLDQALVVSANRLRLPRKKK